MGGTIFAKGETYYSGNAGAFVLQLYKLCVCNIILSIKNRCCYWYEHSQVNGKVEE